ncbi:flagellar basal body P-ring formation chaperone FlgA [Marinobacterium litorale]|jgi:flagella basal body P-ring formation protein FlgA|uniref:flagellar basal body P-ring formation chaperone FlgA n=1 Tax=Marinobacterium litorale TaxID=404770 RepID=UPI000A048540|nr:flagellar basal body P-ring formation chaperone FlgA [Marinobacterium litorale]
MSYCKALKTFQDSGVRFFSFIPVWVALATLLALAPFGYASADTDFNSDIESAVASTIRQVYQTRLPDSRVNVTVNPINRTLSLTPCAQAPLIELPFANGARVTAKVSCTAPAAWSLFVTARVEQFAALVVANRPISRDERIDSQALTLQERDVTRLRGDYYTRLQDVVGQSARTTIDNGEVISPRDLTATLAVRRGDLITLEVRRGTLLIRTKGIALEDGHINQQIDVKNQRSGRELRGLVTAPGVVSIP